MSDLTESTTLLPALKSRCFRLLEEIASRSSDLDVWNVVAELVEEHDPTIGSVTTVGLKPQVSEYLTKDWSNEFLGDSLSILRTVIHNFERKPKSEKDEFYSRMLVFLQSSGVGKSRLADTFGRDCLMINYVLREKGAAGFPPPDDDILSFMQMCPQQEHETTLSASPNKSRNTNKQYPAARADIIWYHSLAVGVLQASFEELHIWVVKNDSVSSLTELAARRHEEMAHNSKGYTERFMFCYEVVKRAKDIADELIRDPAWRRTFDNDEDSTIRLELTHGGGHGLDRLWGTAARLTRLLEKIKSKSKSKPENRYDPLLVVVFDEASSLLKEPGKDDINTGRYVALNRIMSCLREYRIWFFIISTESQVGAIMPPDDAKRDSDSAGKPSLRQPTAAGGPPLKRIPPFLAFPLNIQDVEAMQGQNELNEKLSDFGTQKHMAMFGRRLWYAYIDDPRGMNILAKQKLIGGVRGSYDPSNVDHVFAALSFRLSLDACLYNSKAVDLINNAVNSHMRVVLGMDHRAGIMHTMSPSEPIIANAAMQHLCIESNWRTSILTLVKELIEKGIVEKGLKGELYARLVLILAHDRIRRPQAQQQNNQEFQGTHSVDPAIYSLTTFTVREFLTSLYASNKFFEEIDGTILQARMNFTHFASTHESLRPDVISNLLVDLLRRSAALQLGPVQATYDILIPIYFGDKNKPLDPSECGFIVVQVKNRDAGTTPKAIFREDFTKFEDSDDAPLKHKKPKTSKGTPPSAEEEEASEDASTDTEKKGPVRDGPYFVFNERKKPILFLLFDLGVVKSTAPAIEVSYTSKKENIPCVWAIHSRGHGDTVFGCLPFMDCASASDSFFKASVLGSRSQHDRATQRNDCFYKLDRSFRYPSATEGTSNSTPQSGGE
jgi:hypothetical protein